MASLHVFFFNVKGHPLKPAADKIGFFMSFITLRRINKEVINGWTPLIFRVKYILLNNNTKH